MLPHSSNICWTHPVRGASLLTQGPLRTPQPSLSLSTGFSSSGLSMSLGLPYNMTAQLPAQEFRETQVQAR